MVRYVTTEKGTYLIRGSWKVTELRAQYISFQHKYNSKITFDQWLVQYGKVYFMKDQER